MHSIAATIAPLSVLLIVTSYLLGSLTGDRARSWIARLIRGKSGAGTPTWLEQGFISKGGAVVLEIVVAALAAWLALRHAPVGNALSVTAHGYLAAFAALLGNVWPLGRWSHGGTGVTTLAGALLVLWPEASVGALVVGLLVWISTGYPGLAAVLAALGLPLLAWWSGADVPRLAFVLAAAGVIVFTQRGHLARLRAGTEPRLARARRWHRWRRG